MKKSFSLYRKLTNEDVKIVYIEEDTTNKTYFIKVEADTIEDFLLKSGLPELLKQHLREDIVDIVKGYNELITGKIYSSMMREICYNYFRNTLEKFKLKHGSDYYFTENNIDE